MVIVFLIHCHESYYSILRDNLPREKKSKRQCWGNNDLELVCMRNHDSCQSSKWGAKRYYFYISLLSWYIAGISYQYYCIVLRNESNSYIYFLSRNDICLRSKLSVCVLLRSHLWNLLNLSWTECHPNCPKRYSKIKSIHDIINEGEGCIPYTNVCIVALNSLRSSNAIYHR